MRRARATLAAGVLLAGLAACGDDDDAEAASDESANLAGDDGGATEEFCDAAVAVETPRTWRPRTAGATPRPSTRRCRRRRTSRPEAVAADVEVLVAEAREMAAQPETEEGPPVIPSDEYFVSSATVSDFLADSCDLEAVAITAQEYAFDGFPESLAAGTTLLDFSNDGSSTRSP